MKKTLVALAALAVVSAASAQSTVTIYGLVDMSLASATSNFNTTRTDGTVNSVANGISNGSRIGFKGTEDLGGGLKANFLMEFGPAPDAAGTTFANRQSYVGLSGNFGAVTLGRQYSPYYVVQGAVDLVGNANSGIGYVVQNHFNDTGRVSNAVNYASPDFGGFSGLFQVAAGDETTTGTGKSYGAAGIYAKGPVLVGLAYNEVTTPTGVVGSLFGTTAGAAAGVSAAGVATAATAATGVSNGVKVWALGGSYDFTVVKAALAYSSLKDSKVTANTDMASKGWNASVAAPLGAVTLSANLGRANVTSDLVGFDAITVVGYQLRADYALSKRTSLYTIYGRDTYSFDVATDAKVSQYAAGVKHTF